MPRQEWDDDTMMREREREWEMRDRDERRRDRDEDSGGFFGSSREDRQRDDDRYAIGGWGDRAEPRSRERGRNAGRFGSDDFNRGIPMDETQRLIASNKVEGTPVYDRHGDRLGSIHNFMVDKRKGKVVYAVLKHGGGFLGLNERYFPLEWDQLTYDTRLEGYHTDLLEEDLKNFGSFDSEGRYYRRTPRGRRREYDRASW